MAGLVCAPESITLKKNPNKFIGWNNQSLFLLFLFVLCVVSYTDDINQRSEKQAKLKRNKWKRFIFSVAVATNWNRWKRGKFDLGAVTFHQKCPPLVSDHHFMLVLSMTSRLVTNNVGANVWNCWRLSRCCTHVGGATRNKGQELHRRNRPPS